MPAPFAVAFSRAPITPLPPKGGAPMARRPSGSTALPFPAGTGKEGEATANAVRLSLRLF